MPYDPDINAALERLRLRVFADGDFLSPDSLGLPAPASLEDLMTEDYWEYLGTCGTHSILDIAAGVIPAEESDQEFSTIRPLTSDEAEGLFGVPTPTRSDFARVSESEALYECVNGGRNTGRSVVLWDADTPSEIAFWGYSGD